MTCNDRMNRGQGCEKYAYTKAIKMKTVTAVGEG